MNGIIEPKIKILMPDGGERKVKGSSDVFSEVNSTLLTHIIQFRDRDHNAWRIVDKYV